MVVMEKNKERYPEAALGYVTALKENQPPKSSYSPVPIGFCLHSSMLLLGEGKREVNVLFCLTVESLVFMDDTVRQIADVQEISRDEALFKILHDAFHLWVSTVDGWQAVENFYIRLEEGKGLLLTFRLDEDFPAVSPLEGEKLPSLRLLVNSTAWLSPYSWARRMLVRSVKVAVSVQGIRNIQMHNDLGRIDIHQAFTPFGAMGDKGAWLAFGNYEMACKPLSTVELTFNWQHLPTYDGGLKEYYQNYDKDIDNCSFKGRIDQFRNRSWKSLASSAECFLFRTSSEAVPVKDGPLVEYTTIRFPISDHAVLPMGGADKFQLSDVCSGFFRLVLIEPDMGFGMHEYRRLFSEIMMYSGRARHKKPLPEVPLDLLMDAPQLGYVAEEEYVFNVGSTLDMVFSYIRPLSNSITALPDTSHPIPLLEGPEDEGNLMIGIRGGR